MHSSVEKIKEKLSITDVVGGYVKLEKSGIYFKARCPFHNEKTPSFFVSPSRNSFHCFGCGKGGDIFTFVQEIEGIEFRDALRLLADRAHVSLETLGPEAITQKDNKKLYALLESATVFFQGELAKNDAARKYLSARGLTDETIGMFAVGFAPDAGSALRDHLKQDDYSIDEMKKTGMIAENERGSYDRFRSRIMFPIHDQQGRTVAFSGRIFGNAAKDENIAKYVNSPETILYSKSRILFGYDKAKTAIMRDDLAIVVEGQMDLLMAHQAGTKNAVAVSGTALTISHLALLKRFTEHLAFSFDSDSAGINAAKRSIELAIDEGMESSLILLPDKKDPADLIQEDPKLWFDAVEKKMNVIDFFLRRVLDENIPKKDELVRIKQDVLPYVARLKSPMERGHYLSKIASAVSMNEQDIRDEVKQIAIKLEEENKQVTEKPYMVEKKSEQNPLRDRIVGYVLLSQERRPSSEFLKKIRAEFDRINEITFEMIAKSLEPPDRERLLFLAEASFGVDDEKQIEINELLGFFEIEKLSEKLELLLSELRRVESLKEQEKIQVLLEQIKTISSAIHEIKSKLS